MEFTKLEGQDVIEVQGESLMLGALPTVLYTHLYTLPDNRLDACDDMNDTSSTTTETVHTYDPASFT